MGRGLWEGIPFPGVWARIGVWGNFKENPRIDNEIIMTSLLEILTASLNT